MLRSLAPQIHIAMAFLTFYITHPDETTARDIVGRLLEERLIACANIFPISSMYRWEGVVQNESEWVSLVKTSLELEKQVESAVLKIHPYETPCILRMEVRANEAYEKWIVDSVGKVVEKVEG